MVWLFAPSFMRKKVILATILTDQTDLNLRTWLTANTPWNGSAPNQTFEITVDDGVTIDASGRTVPSMDVENFPSGTNLTLFINATAMVTGAGAIGGRGGNFPPSEIDGAPGLSGGHAIRYDQDISVGGDGTLQGGGGGGGGGSLTGNTRGGGGGGGGAGKAVGAGGVGGIGGLGDTGNDKGGTGGAPGAAGGVGQSGPGIQVGGAGGAAGKAAQQIGGTFTDISGGGLTILGATA